MTDQLDPTRTVVLVMDYQRSIVDAVAERTGHPAPVDAAARAVATARAAGALVGHVRVALTDEEAAAAPAHSLFGRAIAARPAGSMHPDHPGTAFDERVAPEPGDVVVRKSRVGAFSTTDLDARLRAAGVTTVVLAGLSTSGVVLTTVREAADRDFRVVVLGDACADPRADVHDVLLSAVFPTQALVTTTDRLPGLLGAT
ncbi:MULTISPECIES: isochorismatase family protein [unclassified Pseudonocardia]|uniref:isochorismatase family protein n=1 Tax=unclassified Pseudonocardia TaxID=2619320 RepID=UPI001CF64D65|nr:MULTISPECIES: isochorismatase family protein [unclassified Pseudonocardia]